MKTRPQIHRSTCPACKARVETADLSADRDFPFCSRRCKLVDLGEWFDGEHRIEGPLQGDEE